MWSYAGRKECYQVLWQQVSGFPRAPEAKLILYPVVGRIVTQAQRPVSPFKSPNYLAPVLVSCSAGLTEQGREGRALRGQSMVITQEKSTDPGYRYLPITASAGMALPGMISLMLSTRYRIAKWSLFYWISITAGFAAVGLGRVAMVWCLISGLSAAYHWWDHLAVQAAPGLLLDRFWFYGWLYSRCFVYLLCTVSFTGLIGVSQVLLMQFFGSADELLMQGAVIFDNGEQFRWVRYFTAPLLHVSLAHHLSNGGVLLLLAVLAGPLLGSRYLLLVYSSSVGSMFVVELVYGYWPFEGDGIVGLSGGLAGVLGWLLGLSLRCRQLFPRYYCLNLLALLLVTLLVLPLVVSQGSLVCHLVGCLLGLCLVLVLPINQITSGWATPEVSSGSLNADKIDLRNRTRQ